MKKKSIASCLIFIALIFSTMTVNAFDPEDVHQASINRDSVLVMEESNGQGKYELTVAETLGYQEIYFPIGTDFTKLKFVFTYDKMNFTIDDWDQVVHNITEQQIKGYEMGIRQRILPYILRYSEDGALLSMVRECLIFNLKVEAHTR